MFKMSNSKIENAPLDYNTKEKAYSLRFLCFTFSVHKKHILFSALS